MYDKDDTSCKKEPMAKKKSGSFKKDSWFIIISGRVAASCSNADADGSEKR